MVTLGYKDTLAHDGILTAGKYVRIYYYKEKTEHYTNVTILRVDIKNAETALRKNQNILISSSKF